MGRTLPFWSLEIAASVVVAGGARVFDSGDIVAEIARGMARSSEHTPVDSIVMTHASSQFPLANVAEFWMTG